VTHCQLNRRLQRNRQRLRCHAAAASGRGGTRARHARRSRRAASRPRCKAWRGSCTKCRRASSGSPASLYLAGHVLACNGTPPN
ncbi:MAG: hypothetical protein MZV49_20970, partial [Rhodopseudomonas palustris]|nr:hypothetical protein [Rhodopseudomonas palustris]